MISETIRCIVIVAMFAAIVLVPFRYSHSQTPTIPLDETFTLNLKDTDIHSLIEMVSVRTGKNFIVDPRIKAKVTVITSEPIDEEKLYQIFLSILDVHGFATVPTGDMIKIVPITAAVKSPIPILSEPSIDSD